MVDLNNSIEVIDEIICNGKMDILIGNVTKFDIAKSIVEDIRNLFEFNGLENVDINIRMKIGQEEIYISPKISHPEEKNRVETSLFFEADKADKAILESIDVSGEEKVIRAIIGGGQKRVIKGGYGEAFVMTQTDLINVMGVSKSKVSVILSSMNSKKMILKIRNGKENIIAMQLSKIIELGIDTCENVVTTAESSIFENENKEIDALKLALSVSNKRIAELEKEKAEAAIVVISEKENMLKTIQEISDRANASEKTAAYEKKESVIAKSELENLKAILNDKNEKILSLEEKLKKISYNEDINVGFSLIGRAKEVFDAIVKESGTNSIIMPKELRLKYFSEMDDSSFSKYKKMLIQHGYICQESGAIKLTSDANITAHACDSSKETEIAGKAVKPLIGRMKQFYDAIVKRGGHVKESDLKTELQELKTNFFGYKKKLKDLGFIMVKDGIISIISEENDTNVSSVKIGTDIEQIQNKFEKLRNMEFSGELITPESVADNLDMELDEASELLEIYANEEKGS